MKALAGTGGTSGAGGAGKTPTAGERTKQAGIPYDPDVEKLQTILVGLDKKAGNTKYQELLGGFGPNKDGVDGKLGKYTTAAIQQFVKDYPDSVNNKKLKSLMTRYGITAGGAGGGQIPTTDPELQWLQNQLLDIDKNAGNNKYGSMIGDDGADGLLTNGSKAAIERFLKDNPTAINEPKIKIILGRYPSIAVPTASTSAAGRNSSGPDPDLQWVQKELLAIDKNAGNNKYGRLLGSAGADGYMTPETLSAVKQFLKDNPTAVNEPKIKTILGRYPSISETPTRSAGGTSFQPPPMDGARARELYRQATGVNLTGSQDSEKPGMGARARELYRIAQGVDPRVPTNSKPLQAGEIYKRETGMEPRLAVPTDPNSPAEVRDRIKSKEYQDRKDREGPNPKIW
jgi:hypothetical protein